MSIQLQLCEERREVVRCMPEGSSYLECLKRRGEMVRVFVERGRVDIELEEGRREMIKRSVPVRADDLQPLQRGWKMIDRECELHSQSEFHKRGWEVINWLIKVVQEVSEVAREVF